MRFLGGKRKKINTAAKTTAIDSFENHESVQVALSVVINALATGILDIKRATALFYGLQLASNNACGFHTEPYAANTVEPSNRHPKSPTSPNPEPPLTPTTASPTTKKTKDSPKNKPIAPRRCFPRRLPATSRINTTTAIQKPVTSVKISEDLRQAISAAPVTLQTHSITV